VGGFRVYAKLCSIFLFSDDGKVIVYVVSCPVQGCHVFLLLGSGCSHPAGPKHVANVHDKTNDNTILLLLLLLLFGLWGYWHCGHYWPIVSASGDSEDDMESRWNVDWQGKPKFLEKTCPSATFVHHKIPHDQTRVWTRAAAMWSRRLTAWAMARPTGGTRSENEVGMGGMRNANTASSKKNAGVIKTCH
jgi:hypothetical protein